MFNMGSAPSLADIAAVTKDGNGYKYLRHRQCN